MSITLVSKGKVADIYRVDEDESIRIHNRTNRFSVGDKVFPGEVSNKGAVLTQMSWQWKELLEEALEIKTDIYSQNSKVLLEYGVPREFAGSAVAVYQCIPIPLECIVRGYYIPESKSWNPYKETGEMYGNKLPAGLKESEKLPVPIYTPSTKAAPGEHDRNITFEETIDILSDFINSKIDLVSSVNIHEAAKEMAEEIRDASLDAYNFAYGYALEKGIILADTKLEFGLLQDEDGTYSLVLIDEVFTPDSSRFWDVNAYKVGKPQASIDKQYIRRYIYDQLCWDGNSEPPVVPQSVLNQLSHIYSNIYYKLFKVDIEKVVANISDQWLSYARSKKIF